MIFTVSCFSFGHLRPPVWQTYHDNRRLLTRNKSFEKVLNLFDQKALGYYLRSSRKDLDDQTIWKLYITLTRVESGFRALKSDLGLRTIFHQREDRCDSHILVTILAYRILHWIEYTLQTHKITKSWTTIKRLLQTHCYTTIICPSEQGTVYHIRIAGTPDHEQSRLYALFGIDWSKLPRKQVAL